jgi:hypothetical protein
METTTCPECEAPAEIRGRSVWESTDGPIEHIRVECIQRHWFLMSVDSLAAAHRRGARATFGGLRMVRRGG